MTVAYRLRPASDDDLEFLFQVYSSTRQEELAQTPWDAAQKEAFLRQQFDAQHTYYHDHYHPASYDVIEVDGAPAGRLYQAHWADDWRIIDIALLPQARRCGVGTAILQDLQARAREAGVPLSIHVERNNPALALYDRLGFTLSEDKGVYLFLVWKP